MAKSYKLTQVNVFENSKFTKKPLVMGNQYSLDGIPPEPQTKIFKAHDQINHKDFIKYIIEHEMEETACGRVNNSSFEKYIRKEKIESFYSQQNQILLLSGKKRFVIDFCRKTKDVTYIKIKTLKIDMASLLSKLPHVKGVWFRFEKGLVKASALMGSNLESTTDFQKFKEEGDISTLSFHYEFSNAVHPIMVTDDGAIVLYYTYKEIKDEIDIVMDIYEELLLPIAKIEE